MHSVDPGVPPAARTGWEHSVCCRLQRVRVAMTNRDSYPAAPWRAQKEEA